jgi:protease stability complex PrcB-like protein
VVAVAACSGGATVTTRTIDFVDHGTSQQSGNDGDARVVVATDPVRTGLDQLVTGQRTGRLFIAVFAGTQRTGGYAVRVQSVERTGDRLIVHARFDAPSPGALTIQVITSPAQLISIAAADATGVSEALLVDAAGTERSRTTVTQSAP